MVTLPLIGGGYSIEKYYASEIDKYAIKISKNNFPNIIQLGDINNWQQWNIDWRNIDLLIGGSPCQGFSIAGKQLNFNDERSKLFFVYVDILKHIRSYNPNVKFLLENVKMKQSYQDVITSFLEVKPIEINSSLLSAQTRLRLYWTNIKGVIQPQDKHLFLKDVLDDTYSVNEILSPTIQNRFNLLENNSYAIGTTRPVFRTIGQRDFVFGDNNKMGCLTATDYKQPKQVLHNGILRKISPVEAERLQTLPDNYTNGVSNTQRFKCIGNGWTVDVIAHILSFIPR